MSPTEQQQSKTGEGGAADAQTRTACTPCRGTGRVSSALGGEAHELTCPWCGGDGLFHQGRDAQAEVAPANGT